MATATNTTIEIEAPIQRVYEVITDFEAYPDFLPETKKVVVDKQSAKAATVTFTIEVIKKIVYTLEMKLNPGKEVSWNLVKGDFMKANSGYWKLESLKKNLTRADYAIEMALGALVPNAVTKKLVETSLPAMMKRFKERMEEGE